MNNVKLKLGDKVKLTRYPPFNYDREATVTKIYEHYVVCTTESGYNECLLKVECQPPFEHKQNKIILLEETNYENQSS